MTLVLTVITHLVMLVLIGGNVIWRATYPGVELSDGVVETGAVVTGFDRRTGIVAFGYFHEGTFAGTSEGPDPLFLLRVKPVREHLGLDLSNGIGGSMLAGALAGFR
jgi:hypothetical protein